LTWPKRLGEETGKYSVLALDEFQKVGKFREPIDFFLPLVGIVQAFYTYGYGSPIADRSILITSARPLAETR